MSGTTCAFLTGLALGVGLMYLLDPQAGRRRRALVRDKAHSWANDAEDYAEKTARHLRNKAQGVVHEARSAVAAKA
jgi:YtxH-like protein